MRDAQQALILSLRGMEGDIVGLAAKLAVFTSTYQQLGREVFQQPGTTGGEFRQRDFHNALSLPEFHLAVANRMRAAGLATVLMAGRVALGQTPPVPSDPSWVKWWEHQIRTVVREER